MRKSFRKAIDNSMRKITQSYEHRYKSDRLYIGGPTAGAEMRLLHLRKIQRIFNSAYKRSLAIQDDYQKSPTKLNARRLERSKSNMNDCTGAMAHANFVTSGMHIVQDVKIGDFGERHELRC
jgi:hypothetical protein